MEQLTAVRIKDLRIEEQTTRPCKEKDTCSHVRVVACTPRRIGHGHIKLGLLILSRGTRRHLAGKDAWRNAVDADLGLGESSGHHARHVDEA